MSGRLDGDFVMVIDGLVTFALLNGQTAEAKFSLRFPVGP